MLAGLGRYQHLAPLLLRIGVGVTFVFAGYGKTAGGLDRVVGFFGSLGVPLPGIMAPFIAYLELLGGIAVLLGVATRLSGLLLAADMFFAIFLARWSQAVANGGFDFTALRAEFLLLLGGLALALSGAGALSLDARLFPEGRAAGQGKPA